MLRLSLFCLSLCSLSLADDRKWDFMGSRPVPVPAPIASVKPATENPYPAWYHMPKQQHTPSYGNYERVDRPSQAANSYNSFPPSSYGRQPSGPSFGPGPEMGNVPVNPRRNFPQDPNAELLAAIRDVVSKFKASLDESGLDQDVRHVSKQLQNTWQQIRAGPMNEQLSQMFSRVHSAADSPNVNRRQ